VIRNAVPDFADRVSVIVTTFMPVRSRGTWRVSPAHASALLLTLRLLPAGSGGKWISIRKLIAAAGDSARNVS
jgi:hypothetical protein